MSTPLRHPKSDRRGSIALLLPGHGAQHVRMAAGLYDHDETFTASVDEGFRLLGRAGTHLRAEWLAEHPSVTFDDVATAHPLLYVVEHALGRMVSEWDVDVTALLGHGVGELAAATLAGVITLSDGVGLLERQAGALTRMPVGRLLAVAAGLEDLVDVVGGDLHVAAVDGTGRSVLGGADAAVREASATLSARGVPCRQLPTCRALHTPLVGGAVRGTLADFEKVVFSPPAVRLYSGHTMGRVTDHEATDPHFWAWQVGNTVYFGSALATLVGEERPGILLEVGPGHGLTVVTRRHQAVREAGTEVLPLLPARRNTDASDRQTVRHARTRSEAVGRVRHLVAVPSA